MAPASTGGWPRLEAPPIVEVMCGVFFAPIPDIDPIFVGGLQQYLGGDYPRHAIQPAVLDAPGAFFSQGMPPLRSWLISASDDWLLQVQPDRFYVNWRRRGTEYPRFSGPRGVLERALSEIARFRQLCRDHLRTEIAASAVEVAKVDVIIEGVHWRDIEELGRVVPLIGNLTRFSRPPNLELGVNIVDRDTVGGSRVVGLSLSTETVFEDRLARAVKIETRCTQPLTGQDPDALRAGFEKLNTTANAAFFGLIAEAELGRFSKKG